MAVRMEMASADYDEKEDRKEYKLFNKYFFPILQQNITDARNDVSFRLPDKKTLKDNFDAGTGLPLLVTYILLTIPSLFDVLKRATLTARFRPT